MYELLDSTEETEGEAADEDEGSDYGEEQAAADEAHAVDKDKEMSVIDLANSSEDDDEEEVASAEKVKGRRGRGKAGAGAKKETSAAKKGEKHISAVPKQKTAYHMAALCICTWGSWVYRCCLRSSHSHLATTQCRVQHCSELIYVID